MTTRRTDQLDICPDCGIFTQTLGTAPNRQFIIRWKTTYFNFAGNAEYEVATDRRLQYAVGDLRGEREQRLDGSQRASSKI